MSSTLARGRTLSDVLRPIVLTPDSCYHKEDRSPLPRCCHKSAFVASAMTNPATPSSLRRPSLPSLAPPNAPLPALPVRSPRRRLPDSPLSIDSKSSSSALFLPTRTSSRSPHSTSSIPTLRTTQSIPLRLPTPTKTPRHHASIDAFPQPPKGPSSRPSLPPSLLSCTDAPSIVDNLLTRHTKSRTPHEISTMRLRAKSSGYGPRVRTSASSLRSPSLLLRGVSEGTSISGGSCGRLSDSVFSIPSPPPSPPSSAQSSCGTASTPCKEVDGGARNRLKGHNDLIYDEQDASAKEASGNVIVSVRVRPEGGNRSASGRNFGWTVDGERSLINFEGRDYFYG